MRGINLAAELDTGITVVAASANSLEDILGAEYLARTILDLLLTKGMRTSYACLKYLTFDKSEL